MGLRLFNRKRTTEVAGPAEMGRVSARYNDYFARVFAYVHSCLGSETGAEEIVEQAFGRAFSRAGVGDEDRFRTELFRAARRLCGPAAKGDKSSDGSSLTAREREVLSLVFDAGLTREQIAPLFRIPSKAVSASLMTGLRKLKERTSPAVAAAQASPA